MTAKVQNVSTLALFKYIVWFSSDSRIRVYDLVFLLQENGYQLLFLSARSISQAYLTRQFLFNLMQVFYLKCTFPFSPHPLV